MAYYRKKPVVIQAFRWTGGPDQTEDPDWICDAIRDGRVYFSSAGSDTVRMLVRTLEGEMCANIGDWVILGVAGEIYPCRNDIFEATYEPAGD